MPPSPQGEGLAAAPQSFTQLLDKRKLVVPALNRVVGHEITHILEGTDLYDSLAMAVAAYAKTKGEYESENSHQWLDENGWNDRIAYMLDHDEIYPVVIHISKARDGRNLLNDVSVIKKEKSRIDMDATALTTQSVRAPGSKENGTQSAVLVLDSSSKKITQQTEKVKQQFFLSNSANVKKSYTI